MKAPDLDWLLSGDPVLSALVKRDLMGDTSQMPAILTDRRIKEMVRDIADWPWPPCVSHKSAGHPIHKFAFLADIGLELEGTKAGDLAWKVQNGMDDGLPRITVNIPEHYGGTGRPTMGWSLCDAPLLLHSLAQCFPGMDLAPGMSRLNDLARENGMPCAVSPELGRFRGPGRKDDPCPIACLYALKAARAIEPGKNERLARTISASLLDLWSSSRERHPYMFFMGTDFRKLKLPFVWYDVLSVTDALSECPWVLDDARFRDMLSVIGSKQDPEGRYTPESVWTAWKGWDFTQKKEPSRWVTFAVERIHRRVGRG